MPDTTDTTTTTPTTTTNGDTMSTTTTPDAPKTTPTNAKPKTTKTAAANAVAKRTGKTAPKSATTPPKTTPKTTGSTTAPKTGSKPDNAPESKPKPKRTTTPKPDAKTASKPKPKSAAKPKTTPTDPALVAITRRANALWRVHETTRTPINTTDVDAIRAVLADAKTAPLAAIGCKTIGACIKLANATETPTRDIQLAAHALLRAYSQHRYGLDNGGSKIKIRGVKLYAIIAAIHEYNAKPDAFIKKYADAPKTVAKTAA